MAEETFNPDSMPKTERYQIPYPGPDNLVRFAADQFGAMATAIDEKLGDVDDRQTDAARATIVRNTLTELQQTSPAIGQFGYVTDDGNNTGIWCWNGGSWSKVSGATPLTVVKPTLAELQAVTNLSEGVFGLVSDDPVASNNGVYVFNNGAWAPITGTSGGTLAASTLSQLQATSAPTGTLAYVSADEQNNGVYVRTAAGEWEAVASDSGPSSMEPTTSLTQDDIAVCYKSGTKFRLGVMGLPNYIASGSLFGDGQIHKITNSDGTNLAAIRLEPGLYENPSWTLKTDYLAKRGQTDLISMSATFKAYLTGTENVDYMTVNGQTLVINPIDIYFATGLLTYSGTISDFTVRESDIKNVYPISLNATRVIQINGVDRA